MDRTDVDFKTWLSDVDRRIFNCLGLRREELPDEPYRDNYEAGTTSQEMAEMVIRNNEDILGF